MPATSASPLLDFAASPVPRHRLPTRPIQHQGRLTTEITSFFDLLASPAPAATIQAAGLAIATTLAALERAPAQGPLTDALLACAEARLNHPSAALPVDETSLASVRALSSSGWTGSLARVFAAPAWQTPRLKPLADQAPWLCAIYSRYLFTAPAFFSTTAQEQLWAAHILTHLEPLLRMLEINRGSSVLKTAAQGAMDAAPLWPGAGSDEQIRRRQQAVGRLRTLLAPRLAPFQAPPSPLSGRPLRVGLISEQPAGIRSVFDGPRLSALLDTERIALTSHLIDDLPGDLAARVETLRTAQFDAVIFAGDLNRGDSPLAALALHRLAPRQFATALCPLTTGLPEIDVMLTDSLAAASAHTEQLAVLPAALAFDPPPAPAAAGPVSAPTRADLGLPEDARLYAATAHPAYIPAATRARWQALLEQDASARLILLPGTSGPELDRLAAEFDGLAGERVLLAGNAPLDENTLATLLRVSDVYLISGSPGDHANRSLAQHLGLAVPDAPARRDFPSFADALTEMLETACRTPGRPLLAGAPADTLADRRRQAQDLLSRGRADRAVTYLLAAIEDPSAGAETWHELGLALHANHQAPEAIQALETCVQLAPDRLDTWLQLAEWANDYGHAELVADIIEVVQALAPHDPRVTALATTG